MMTHTTRRLTVGERNKSEHDCRALRELARRVAGREAREAFLKEWPKLVDHLLEAFQYGLKCLAYRTDTPQGEVAKFYMARWGARPQTHRLLELLVKTLTAYKELLAKDAEARLELPEGARGEVAHMLNTMATEMEMLKESLPSPRRDMPER